MTRSLEFYFDFGSPTTYLAYTQLPALAERTGAEIIWKPALLGGIFKETGNQSPATNPAKGAWMGSDIRRFAKRYDVPFKMNPHFPINTLYLMRGALVAQRDGYFDLYTEAIFNAMWIDGKDMGDPAIVEQVVEQVLSAAGIDGQALFAAIQEPEIKQALIDQTAEAVERGLFGMPAIFVGDELFFGQDRLDFVEEALRDQPSAHKPWISPLRSQFKEYATHPEAETKPVVMLNLLKFDGPDGARIYNEKYGLAATQFVKELGGRIVWSGQVDQVLAGSTHRNDWDAVVLVSYPSRSALLSMMKNPAYQAIHVHREAGLADTALIALSELMRDLSD